MKIHSLLLLSLSFIPFHALAQGDVCCVSAKVMGESVDTQASQKSAADCKPGGTDAEKVCAAVKDENNLCSEFSKEKQCKACGYFWVGTTCLKTDPVAKAKADLEKEAKEKKEKEKK